MSRLTQIYRDDIPAGHIDIKGINKRRLLKDLWINAWPEPQFMNLRMADPTFNDNLTDEAILGYIGYYAGRSIKTDISGDTADPRQYDLKAGEGMFAWIVESLRR